MHFFIFKQSCVLAFAGTTEKKGNLFEGMKEMDIIKSEPGICLVEEKRVSITITESPVVSELPQADKELHKFDNLEGNSGKVTSDYELPGHVHNLTFDQTKAMYKLWIDVIDRAEQYGPYIGGIPEDERSLSPSSSKSWFFSWKKSQEGSSLSEGDDDFLFSSSSGSNYEEAETDVEGSTRPFMKKKESKRPVPCTTYAEELWRGFISSSDDMDGTILRFLRARKWNTEAASAMFLDTIDWRAKMGVFDMVKGGEAGVKRELLESGKSFFHGLDREGRPIIYGLAKLHDSNAQTLEESQMHTIYNMEVGRRLLPKGKETIVLVFDLTDAPFSSMDFPPVRFLVSCFQSHYPESLGVCLVVNAPWLFWAFWNLVKPLLDPVVAGKIRFVTYEELGSYIEPSVLLKQFGGLNEYEYKYDLPRDPPGAALGARNRTEADCDSDSSAEEVERLKLQFIEKKREFVSITRQIAAVLDESDNERVLEELETIFLMREQIKSDFQRIAICLDRITIPRTYYDRIGAISGNNS